MSDGATFLGYPRVGRRPGVRNLALVLPTSEAVNSVAERVDALAPDAVTITHFNASAGGPRRFHLDVLTGFGSNPNVGHVVLVGLGDADDIGPDLLEQLTRRGVPAELHTLREARGLDPLVERVAARAASLAAELATVERTPVPIAELVVGTECGGSDAYSGLTANPALGRAVDLLAAAGGTAFLCEIPELIGAEHLLAARAVSPAVAAKLVDAVGRWESMIAGFGEDLRGAQPSPGNQDGGLTTIEEKSLGAVAKGGSSPLVDVVGYGEEPTVRGLVVMDTPGHDVEQLTGMAAGAAQIVVFTTGRGTPTASPVAPTIKVATNSRIAARMAPHFDVDAGPVVEGTATLDEVGRQIFDTILAVASGSETKAERFRQRDFALPRTAPSPRAAAVGVER